MNDEQEKIFQEYRKNVINVANQTGMYYGFMLSLKMLEQTFIQAIKETDNQDYKAGFAFAISLLQDLEPKMKRDCGIDNGMRVHLDIPEQKKGLTVEDAWQLIQSTKDIYKDCPRLKCESDEEFFLRSF